MRPGSASRRNATAPARDAAPVWSATVSDATGPAYPIESVDRALTVILAFEETESITIAEASALLDVSRSTAYRLLNMLEFREFVRQDKRTKAFHGGPALLRVGLAAVQR